MLTVGLVAEGTHDYLMLEPFIRRELSKREIDDITFKFLQPYQDATGSMSGGGWPRVVAWCKTHSGTGLETFFTPLFAGDPECDVIIIHVDGDALEMLVPHTAVQISIPVPDKVTRVDTLVAAIEDFLNAPTSCRSKIALALPVLHTEAWILAAENYPQDPCTIDAKAEFRNSYDFTQTRLADYYRQKVAAATGSNWTDPACYSYSKFSSEVGGLDL
ncbi:hypothetical protein [Agrobacterium tumefaciens]|uniref:hypothetical protein n=1 Tax=Agrobacterium tumefaciens TaxID=358 RepID=UPI0021F9FFBC|nr:hypothetical protein FY157_19665 [Agrobacterium tumefaciens]